MKQWLKPFILLHHIHINFENYKSLSNKAAGKKVFLVKKDNKNKNVNSFPLSESQKCLSIKCFLYKSKVD